MNKNKKIDEYIKDNPSADLKSLPADERLRQIFGALECLPPLLEELEYFTYLMKGNEIDNTMVIRYYEVKILQTLLPIESYFHDLDAENYRGVQDIYYYDRAWMLKGHSKIPPWSWWLAKGTSHDFITGKTVIDRPALLQLFNFLRIIPIDCDIVDCTNGPIHQCPKCQNHYCPDHIDSHDHENPIRTK